MAQGRRTIPFSKPTGFVQAPAGPSVEEAREAMLKSAEVAKTYRLGEKVPQFIEEERAKNERVASRGQGGNTPVVQEPVAQVTPPAPEPVQQREPAEPAPAPQEPKVSADNAIPEPVVAPRVEAEPDDKTRRKVEGKNAAVEFYREGRDWVAELTYTNGAGSEIFKAASKDELLEKLALAKTHATQKIRDQNRRIALGPQLDTWDYFFEKLKQAHGVTVDQFNALPEPSREIIKDTVQAVESEAFLVDFPEFHRTPKNWITLADWLNHNKVPVTQKNLGKAFQELSDGDLLEKPAVAKPVPQATIPAAVTSAPVVSKTAEDSVVVAAAPAAPQTPPVRKRGSSGIIPGQSSAVTSPTVTEEGKEPREPSREELRTMDIKELRRKAIPSLAGRPR